MASIPGDFGASNKVVYWTPRKETADRYAQWAKLQCEISEITIVQAAFRRPSPACAYRSCLIYIQKYIKKRNESAWYESHIKFAKLLVSEQYKDSNACYYRSELYPFTYGRTVEEDTEREEERKLSHATD